jgi:hypothetical protein
MKYKELKSIVEQVINELNLSQGKNRIQSKNINKEGYNPEEDDDVITADPDVKEPETAPKIKPKHPLMPPDEAEETEPKMEQQVKKSVKDIMSKYKSLSK